METKEHYNQSMEQRPIVKCRIQEGFLEEVTFDLKSKGKLTGQKDVEREEQTRQKEYHVQFSLLWRAETWFVPGIDIVT